MNPEARELEVLIPDNIVENIYNAQISAGSLLLKESREIARLLLDQADEVAWHRALVIENVLQKKSPSSARRMAGLIRNRIRTMDPEFWRLILDENREIAVQVLFASAIIHSRLIEDFMVMVVKNITGPSRSRLRQGTGVLSLKRVNLEILLRLLGLIQRLGLWGDYAVALLIARTPLINRLLKLNGVRNFYTCL